MCDMGLPCGDVSCPYIIACECCKKAAGILRIPHLSNRDEAYKMRAYYCDTCFEAVFAGEN